jgi:DNA-binding GntR family transcriptional regulator
MMPSVTPDAVSASKAAATVVVQQPLYEQAYTALSDRIASGEWRPGSRLPAERALADLLGISRLTVRRALFALERDGLVERGASRGWHAASGPMSEPPNELLGFSAMARARGLTPTADVLRQEVREATFSEAEHLRIAPGAPVFDLERLRRFSDIPIAVNRSRLALERVPWITGIDFRTASLHAVLEEAGVKLFRAEFVIEVLDADERLAGFLDVPIGKGLLLSSGLSFDERNTPIEFGWIAHRPDRYRMRTTLNRRTPAAPRRES